MCDFGWVSGVGTVLGWSWAALGCSWAALWGSWTPLGCSWGAYVLLVGMVFGVALVGFVFEASQIAQALRLCSETRLG